MRKRVGRSLSETYRAKDYADVARHALRLVEQTHAGRGDVVAVGVHHERDCRLFRGGDCDCCPDVSLLDVYRATSKKKN